MFQGPELGERRLALRLWQGSGRQMAKFRLELCITERVLLVAFRIGSFGRETLPRPAGDLHPAIQFLGKGLSEFRILFDGHLRHQLA